MATTSGLERHFGRRAVAFVIDVLLVWFVVAVVGWFLATYTDYAVKVPSVLESTRARSLSVTDAGRFDERLNRLRLEGQGRPEAWYTRTDQWFLVPLHTVDVVRTQRDGNTSVTHRVSAPATRDGRPTTLIDLSPVAWLLLALVSALALARGGRTPGKRATDVKVTRAEEIRPPTFGRALGREVVRLAPFFLVSAGGALAWYGIDLPDLPRLGFLPLVDAVNAIGLVGLLLFVPLLWSFVRWRGQAFHDRVARLAVRE